MFLPKFNNSVKKLIKIKDSVIDGPIFNVHCKLTAILLFLASTIVSTQMNVGKPIQCISDVKVGNSHKVIETFCWINSTFRTVPKWTLGKNGSLLYPADIHPRDIPSASIAVGPSEQIYYAYYQWVGFFLFFQAIIFYAPKWFWKLSERKLMSNLMGTENRKYEEGEERRKKSQILAKYFAERLKGHWNYATTYWFLEIVCLCNVVLQLFAMDTFLGGDGLFLSYGLKFSFEDMNVVGWFETFYELDYIFPLQTKCAFHKFGPSGTLQEFDVLCILFLNMYNRYIFAVMWCWFSLLTLLLALLLIYRALVIASPTLRAVLLRTPGKMDSGHKIKSIVYQLPVTDWWVLYMLKANLDIVLFRDIISELFRSLEASKRRRVE